MADTSGEYTSADTVHFDASDLYKNFGDPVFEEYKDHNPGSSITGPPERVTDPEQRMTVPDPSHPALGKLRISIECVIRSELDSPFCLPYVQTHHAWIWGVILGVTALFLIIFLWWLIRRYRRRSARKGQYFVETADLQVIGDAEAGVRKEKRRKFLKEQRANGDNGFHWAGKQFVKMGRQRWAGLMIFGKKSGEKLEKFGDIAKGKGAGATSGPSSIASFEEISEEKQLRERIFNQKQGAAAGNLPHARAFGDSFDFFGGTNDRVLGNWVPFLDSRLLAVGLKEKELHELRALDFDNFLDMLEQSRSIKYEWKDMSCTMDALMLGMRAVRCRVSSSRLGWRKN